MIELRNVTFRYNARIKDSAPAIQSLNMVFHEGEIAAVLGKNGSGKSTLSRIISGILKPQFGEALVDGYSTSIPKEMWEARSRVGIVFQNPDDQIISNNVLDEIVFGPENLGIPRNEIESRIQEISQILQIESIMDYPIHELTFGQKQLVAIAGVLAMRPRYMIFDEPTTSLGPEQTQALLQIIQKFAREYHLGVIYITHNMDEVPFCDTVFVMENGSVIRQGAPSQIFADAMAMRQYGLDIPAVTEIYQRIKTSLTETSVMPLNEEQFAEIFANSAHITQPEATPSAAGSTSDNSDNTQKNTEAASLIIETKDAHFTYKAGTPFAQIGLAGITIRVPQGSFIACVGPTRSGKSTLLDSLNGVLKPGRNMVFYQGKDIHTPGYDLSALRKDVGVVFQSPDAQIIKDVVGKDIAFGLRQLKLSLAESRQRVQESLESVGLNYEEFRNRYTYTLSGGQKRRVTIAGALALRPKILALDEPTAGLDPQGRAGFLQMLKQLGNDRGLTIIYMTANLEDIIALADTIYLLENGKVVMSGSPKEILEHTDTIARMNIGLPAVTRISAAIKRRIPSFAENALNLHELETALLQYAGPNGRGKGLNSL